MGDPRGTNAYSGAWFEVFGSTVDCGQTRHECDWIEGLLQTHPASILDAACGTGRHAAELSRRGHRVLGIDRSEHALHTARGNAPLAEFRCEDISHLPEISRGWDAVLSMWQSFGFGTEQDNLSCFAWMADRLGSGGIMCLDLYDPDFFVGDNLASRRFERAGAAGTEHKTRLQNRLVVELCFDSEELADERFDWHIYTRADITALAVIHGLVVESVGRGFGGAEGEAGSTPRVQYILRRTEGDRHA